MWSVGNTKGRNLDEFYPEWWKIITEKIVKDNHGMPLTPQIASGRMMLHLGGSCETFASDAHLEPFQNGTR